MSGGGKTGSETLVLMGRIGAAHGIRGEVRIQSFAAGPLAIASYGPLLTSRPGLTVTITRARLQKNMVIAALAGIDDRNTAETLGGVELFVPRNSLPPGDDADHFYHTDLIGLSATARDGTRFGMVTAVPNYGAGDLVEIETAPGKTVLLPFTRAVVPVIDLTAGTMTVVPPIEVSGEQERGKE